MKLSRAFDALLATLALSALAASPAYAQATAGHAYVSNQNGDVSVIDLATMSISGTIDAYGEEPRGIGITDDGKLLVVANREGGSIAIIDRARGKLVKRVKIGANPEFVRVRGNLAFISHEPASTGKAPPKEGAPDAAKEGKGGVEGKESAKEGKDAKDADDDKNKEPARIAVVDLKQGKLLRTIKGGLETEGIEFAADGKHILVTNESDDTITVHAIATGKLTKTIDTSPYGKRPRGIKIAPDGKHYVATLEFGNQFVVLGPDYKIVESVKTGDSPYGVAFGPSGDRLYVAAARSKTLQVFDAKTWQHIKDVPTGQRCWHFTFTPDAKQILVACGRSNEVVVIDAEKLEPTKRIPDNNLPWGIVTWPKSHGSLDRPG